MGRHLEVARYTRYNGLFAYAGSCLSRRDAMGITSCQLSPYDRSCWGDLGSGYLELFQSINPAKIYNCPREMPIKSGLPLKLDLGSTNSVLFICRSMYVPASIFPENWCLAITAFPTRILLRRMRESCACTVSQLRRAVLGRFAKDHWFGLLGGPGCRKGFLRQLIYGFYGNLSLSVLSVLFGSGT